MNAGLVIIRPSTMTNVLRRAVARAVSSARGMRRDNNGVEGAVTVSAHDVLRELRSRERTMGAVKAHKLLYYCQGWHLAHYGTPMFTEKIEAWANGPVVSSLWADERHARPKPAPHSLEGTHLDIIDYVIERYGVETGKSLVARSHREDPWRSLADSDDDSWINGSPEIGHEALRSFFGRDGAYNASRRRAEAAPVGYCSLDATVAPDDLVLQQVESLSAGERVVQLTKR